MELFLFMTVSASLLILAALLLRPLTGHVLPRSLQMGLWISASLRLLLPVEIRLPFSLFALFSEKRTSPAPAGSTIVLPEPTDPVLPEAAAPVPADPIVVPGVIPAAESVSFTELLPWIWLAGVILTAGVLLGLHMREMHRCRFKVRDTETERHTPRSVRVYRCAAVAAPFAAGLFRPQIILPDTLPAEDLPAVLAHELAHIRGLDILKKYLFAAALCVNWFNPLVWVMVWLAARDMEILCDRRVLRRPDAPGPKAYAHALLNAAERRTLFTLGFQSNTEVRIMKILKKENTNRFAALLSVLLVALLVTACTTAPAEENSLPAETDSVSAEVFAESDLDSSEKEAEEYADLIKSTEEAEEETATADIYLESELERVPSELPDDVDLSEYTIGFSVIATEEDAYTALENLSEEIEHLERQKDQISALLDVWEKEDEEALGYRHAAMDILGEDANEHELREQIAWLKAEDALGFIARSLPDTTGKECVQINIKREDNDEILSSHVVPKEDYLYYLDKLKSATAEADVYVSFILLQ